MSIVKKYTPIAQTNFQISGMLLYILIFPLLIATFFALLSLNISSFIANLTAYAIYFIGIKVAKQGFLNEKKYKSSNLTLAPKKKLKLYGALILGSGSFTASLFCIGESLISSIVLTLATVVGFILYYGLDPYIDKINGEKSKVITDAIEVINEVKQKLNELEKINYSFYHNDIKKSLIIIISDIKEIVLKIEDDPDLLQKARKLFKVYLTRVTDISKELSLEKNLDKTIENRYLELLNELKISIVKQKELIVQKDLTGLDIQIEALQKQIKQEGV